MMAIGPRPLRITTAGLLLAAVLAPGFADDTDVYIGRVPPVAAEPLVMFSVDTSIDMGAAYAGCTNVGVAPALCAPAQYFKDQCPTCVLPGATEKLTIFDAVRFALRMALLESLGVRVGLMLNHDHAPNCAGPSPASACSNGAYVARGFKPVDVIVTAPVPPATEPTILPGPNLAEFLAILDSIPMAGGATKHPFQGKELFFEFFRYLTGQAVYNGHSGWTDYGTDDSLNLDDDGPAYDWDASAEVLGTYLSPLLSSSPCSRLFTVNIMGSPSRQDDDSDAAIQAGTGSMTGIDLSGPANSLTTVVGYLNDIDLADSALPFGTVPALDGIQNVTSYFVASPTPLNSNPPKFDKRTTEYAGAGGTTRPMALSPDPAVLVENFRSVMTQIASVSTTFVSASVPVNVFDRSRVLDNIYLALFQPDLLAKPFWPGNVKKLRLEVVDVSCSPGDPGCVPGKEVRLVDALGSEATAADGRLRNDALTFWTDPSKVQADPVQGVMAGRDGRHVDEGGAGQRIPGLVSGAPGLSNSDAGARQLYFYGGTGSDLTSLNADVATATLLQAPLGASLLTDAEQLLRYLRGYDAFDADLDTVTHEVRPWLLGDPLHGKPLPINYGAWGGHSAANPAVFLASPTNGGMLHFFRNTSTAAPLENGVEAWAFMPVELLGIVEQLAQNLPAANRVYGLDGAPTVSVKDVDGDGTVESADGDRVYLYFGFRRGGRTYYALDITDPLAPKFLWRISPTDITTASGITASTDYAELGQTFSQPVSATVRTGVDGSGNVETRAVVLFGGGYDGDKDYTAVDLANYNAGTATTGSVSTDDDMGNAIFVADGETGELIWKAVGPSSSATAGAKVFVHADLTDSIPSTLAAVDTDSDGAVDRLAVGDTGGNLWRVDLGGDADGDDAMVDDWELTLVARLGRHAGSGKVADRRFFHPPDYVVSRDGLGPYDAIILGSGDRADPLDYGRARSSALVDAPTQNWIYVVKDRRIAAYSANDSAAGAVFTPSDLTDVSSNCLQDGSCGTPPDLANGWRIQLDQGVGEKALSSPITVAGRVFVTTYLPQAGTAALACGPSEGGGSVYALMLQDGTAAYNFNAADGGIGLTVANSKADRRELLSASGIPSEFVYLRVEDPGGGPDAKCLLGSDLNCRQAPGATEFRTFWHRVE